MAAKKQALTFVQKLRKIKRAGLEESPEIRGNTCIDPLMPLSTRIEQILGLVKRFDKISNKMIYFVMYDIENNKVRTQVARYLIKKGCTRVQKSVFCYENNDSILLVPVSTDEIKAMSIMGQNIDFDLILQNKNTLFF